MAVFTHQVDARAQSFGFERIFDAAKSQWPFQGHGLKPVPTALISYYFERGTASSRVLFMGDSHVQQYYPRIDRLLTDHPDKTKSIVYVSRVGCPPVSYFEGLVNPKCKGVKEFALAIGEELNVDTVVLAAGWFHYNAFDLDGPDDAYRDLASTIARFHKQGKAVYLILPIPKGDAFAPSHLVKRSFGGSGFSIVQHIDRSEVDRWTKPIANKLLEIASSAGAIAVDPMNSFCSVSECPTFADDGLPIYFDESHLRPDYVREHVTYLDDIVLLDKARTGSSNLWLAQRGGPQLFLLQNLLKKIDDSGILLLAKAPIVDMANGPRQRVQPYASTIALLEMLGGSNGHKCVSC